MHYPDIYGSSLAWTGGTTRENTMGGMEKVEAGSAVCVRDQTLGSVLHKRFLNRFDCALETEQRGIMANKIAADGIVPQREPTQCDVYVCAGYRLEGIRWGITKDRPVLLAVKEKIPTKSLSQLG